MGQQNFTPEPGPQAAIRTAFKLRAVRRAVSPAGATEPVQETYFQNNIRIFYFCTTPILIYILLFFLILLRYSK